MLKNHLKFLQRYLDALFLKINPILSQRELLQKLDVIPDWDQKINLYQRYAYDPTIGAWTQIGATYKLNKSHLLEASTQPIRINYGCGQHLLKDWLNIDLHDSNEPNYRKINLLEKHPFGNDVVKFGFSEDMLEHLTQAESIFFLSEAYRTLSKNGVLRLSFPCLEGVLKNHYSMPSETRVREGEFEAYAFWDHVHFYSKDELSLVANHIGFRKIKFVDYGKSEHLELMNLDTRKDQIGLNAYIELTK